MSENKLKERSTKLIANTVNYKIYLVKNVQQRGLDLSATKSHSAPNVREKAPRTDGLMMR